MEKKLDCPVDVNSKEAYSDSSSPHSDNTKNYHCLSQESLSSLSQAFCELKVTIKKDVTRRFLFSFFLTQLQGSKVHWPSCGNK